MTEEAFNRLGALYQKTGMNPPAELVSSRIASTKKIAEKIDDTSLLPLLRGAFGIAKQGELDLINNTLTVDDPYFSPNEGIREAQLISSALLHHILQEDDDSASRAALGLIVASFGGVRAVIDNDLVAQAQKTLAIRRTSRNSLPDKITHKTKPNWTADLNAAQPFADNGQFREVYPSIRKLLENSANYTQSAGTHIANQVQQLLDNQKHLIEQMEIHWWILGAWSIETESPFAEMAAAEAGMRAGLDLAALSTASKFGLFASPALIRQILGEPASTQDIPLKDFALCGPREWRETWTEGLLENIELMSLLPLSSAVCIALDSDEQPDWEPRYSRQLQIPPETTISVRDAAVQLYHEQLFRREFEL